MRKEVGDVTYTSLPAENVETGIAGLDDVAIGGLTEARATLVSGAAGSAKIALADQFSAPCTDSGTQEGRLLVKD